MTVADQNPIQEIEREYGQSVWMDHLSRDLIRSGDLKELTESRGIHGITSNPTIFEKAIAGNQIYDADIAVATRGTRSFV